MLVPTAEGQRYFTVYDCQKKKKRKEDNSSNILAIMLI